MTVLTPSQTLELDELIAKLALLTADKEKVELEIVEARKYMQATEAMSKMEQLGRSSDKTPPSYTFILTPPGLGKTLPVLFVMN